jgi:predicted DNA-binding WGR domain protein
MQARLEKYNHIKKQKRFYMLGVGRNLFGEWYVLREWGRIGAKGGQTRVDYMTSQTEAEAAFHTLKQRKLRRGYASVPEQLKFKYYT